MTIRTHSRSIPRRLAFGETVAPVDVNTLRDESCPVCNNDSSSFDGKTCRECGYDAPPTMFRDPDLEKAKALDLRKDEADEGLGNLPGRDGLTPDQQDDNGGMPGEVPGSGIPGSDEMPVDPSMLDEEGGIDPAPIDPAQIVQEQMEQLQSGVPLTPDMLGPDGEVVPPDQMQQGQMQGQEGLMDPNGEPDEPGEPMGEVVDPNGLDENGVPMASDGQEETVRPGEGDPGTPEDGVADLVCPACGFQADAAQPVSTDMDTQAVPTDGGDGTMAGDVCPACGQAALISVGEMEEQQQMQQQMPQQGSPVQASRLQPRMALLWAVASGRVRMMDTDDLHDFQSHDAGWTFDGDREPMSWVLDDKRERHPNVIKKLKADIATNGIKEPLKVAMHTDPPTLVEGHHRLIAATDLGLSSVPVIDDPDYNDDDD